MKQFKTAFIAVLAVILGFQSFGQDPHFSQYNSSPLNVNPAMTGLFSGNYRFTAIFRSQWSSILRDETIPMFRTFSASFDLRIGIPASRHDAIGVGLSFINDKAGDAAYGTNQPNLSVAYLKSLNSQGNHFLSAGVQAGLGFRSIDYTRLRFGNQFDAAIGDFNPNINNNENFNNNFTFFDLGAGVFWYYFPKKRTNFWAGFSVSHVNMPNQSFGSGDARLYIKYTGTGGVQVPLSNTLDLLPSFLILSQGPAFETQVGTYLKVLFVPNEPQGNAFYIGPWYRIVRGYQKGIASDALILATRFDVASFSFGFAYDLNFSELTDATNSRGAFEVSAIHIGSFRQKNKVKFCPRF
ncbi:MAG: hypothetical protein KatS3mg031_1145 [Chitinophagales bacterium]|nr:MAG: hypothetical protein KatS3mg031_1145 [Chitinophagales bacterium]